MNILVSACLLGIHCRYNGTGSLTESLLPLMADHNLIPVCPEQLGGLPTPRDPAERRGDKVLTQRGIDVTSHFTNGASQVLKLARLYECSLVILKERSPSCGYGEIYDGSFTNSLTPGNGITSDLLSKYQIQILGESKVEDFFNDGSQSIIEEDSYDR